jgi:rod shape-determining protein MreB
MILFDQVFGLFSHDIGIDLGTANTLVYVRGKGILLREPTIITRHKKTKKVLAVGAEAKRMLGKTPINLTSTRPLRDGVISDLEAAEALLHYFVMRVHESPSRFPKVPRPKVVVGIPSGVTEVERRAVRDAVLRAGAREVFLIEEPMAAAIGANLPIHDPKGSMIVDIGGGTTEIAVISLGGIVISKSIRVAGDEMDQDIINYARARYNLLVGEKSAEEIKIAGGSAYPTKAETKLTLRGRDLASGLPSVVTISSGEIREAMAETFALIVAAIKEIIEETPPELVGDLLQEGIVVTGGGALLPGIKELIEKETKMPVVVDEDPLTTVVKGTGKLLDEPQLLESVKITAGLS